MIGRLIAIEILWGSFVYLSCMPSLFRWDAFWLHDSSSHILRLVTWDPSPYIQSLSRPSHTLRWARPPRRLTKASFTRRFTTRHFSRLVTSHDDLVLLGQGLDEVDVWLSRWWRWGFSSSGPHSPLLLNGASSEDEADEMVMRRSKSSLIRLIYDWSRVVPWPVGPMTLQGKLITTKGVSTRILLSAFLDRSRGLHEPKTRGAKNKFPGYYWACRVSFFSFCILCVEYSSYDVLFLPCIYPFYIAVLTRYPNKEFWNFLQLCLGFSMDNRGLHGKFFFSNRFQYMHFVIWNGQIYTSNLKNYIHIIQSITRSPLPYQPHSKTYPHLSDIYT